MDLTHPLKKITCWEWKVPYKGGKSEEFLLRNQKCIFNYCDIVVNPETRQRQLPVLKIESAKEYEVITYSSFEVKVQLITLDYIYTSHPKTLEGRTPFEIWRCDHYGTFGIDDGGIVSFRVMFSEDSNAKLIEDAIVKKEVKTQASHSGKEQMVSPFLLKEVSCLEWNINTEGCPVKKKSPKFVFNNQVYFLTCENSKPRDVRSIYSLSIVSDTENPLLYEMPIRNSNDDPFYDPRNGGIDGTREENRPYSDILTSVCLYDDTESEMLYFRVIFSDCFNIEVIEDADEKTVTGPEESLSMSEQQSLRSLSSDLKKLLLSEDYKPDISLQCGKWSIPAHRIILAMRSDVLKAMLEESDSRILQMVDVKPSVCKKFVEYLYTASLPDLSAELALALHEAGEKYGVDSLQRKCCDFLRENMSDKDVLGHYNKGPFKSSFKPF